MAKTAAATRAAPKSAPPPNSRPAKPPAVDATPRLPASLVAALPVSKEIMQHVAAIEKLLPRLERELDKTRKGGAIPLARAFTVLHRMKTRIDGVLKPFTELFELCKKNYCPEAFERDGVTSVPLAEGFRVGVSSPLYASIVSGQKEAAYEWLRAHDLGDIIQPTVSSSTLSAVAREMLEDKNMELPADLFRVAQVHNTSVTKT